MNALASNALSLSVSDKKLAYSYMWIELHKKEEAKEEPKKKEEKVEEQPKVEENKPEEKCCECCCDDDPVVLEPLQDNSWKINTRDLKDRKLMFKYRLVIKKNSKKPRKLKY